MSFDDDFKPKWGDHRKIIKQLRALFPGSTDNNVKQQEPLGINTERTEPKAKSQPQAPNGEAQPKTEPPSAHTEKGQVKGKEKARRGPKPGTVDRYGKSDRALFPEIERMMREGHKSRYGACLELAENGKVKGGGIPESLAKRLARRFKKERSLSTTR
jgi:hypothetical protein